MKKKGSTHMKDGQTDQQKVDENIQSDVTQETEQEQENHEQEKDGIISEQKSRIEELNNKYLYLFAEFDNFRKRTSKEKLDLIKTASSGIVTAMLPVLDDFERAIRAFPDDENMKSLKDGVVLIYEKYRAVLVKAGLEEIKAMGEEFNTDIHEAVANVPAQTEEQKGKIIDVTEKGYYLNGVVIRFAKVVVAN
ncbi:MAG TPA: nucleotide exchange factor GrpE [Bacteroidales bacterium]|nr:nucleotide exchange factor GrpE [Bacteroidales bacterium]HNZ43494.1 nucleotide exchange factor GrpE [Bacteroidales bacterium]HOH84805.1 nucleotide exchange factor GrpE [Bacteroidales bacterium]HPB25554.1 nucleotide exchange factor GrpE [Bacteroidales bacterium]HPI29087.1 nucleotide exchange factor GrpE [Bacteroidales bacterium]